MAWVLNARMLVALHGSGRQCICYESCLCLEEHCIIALLFYVVVAAAGMLCACLFVTHTRGFVDIGESLCSRM